jgi:uncharacterized membrane protein
MNFPAQLFSSGWSIAAFLPLVALWVWSLRKGDWRRLRNATQLNVWAGTIVALVLLWSMRAGVQPGLNFHLLGAMAFVLMFGPQLAIAGLSIVLAAVTLNGAAAWSAYALNALVMVAVPVLFAHGLYRLVERWLPNHFFVYVFVTAFLGAALTMGATGLAATLLLYAADVYSAHYLLHDYLPYYLLLGFAEATITGMCVTIFVVYRPAWVCTFDDTRYLLNK